jgi:hypothetical protein
MEPLHYDDLPKNSAECWELLGEADRRAAVKAFLTHGEEREDSDLPGFKKAVLKLSGVAEIIKLFDGWPLERRIAKSLQMVGRDKMKNYWSSLVRYWLLVEHRPLIRATLDAAGIPNDKGYIADDYEGVTVEIWKQGLSALWQHEEMPVTLYLGYVLKDTRQGKPAGIWDTLAEALGKGADKPPRNAQPAEVAVISEDRSEKVEVVEQPKAARAEDSGEFLLYEQEIIKALARGAISRTDAVEAEDAVEMARQVIDDAPGRPRVFFLLGFAQSLHRLKADLSGVAGINPERSSWFFGGYVHGLARQLDMKAIAAFIKDNPEMYEAFLKKPDHPAFEQSHAMIGSALAVAEEASLFRGLVVAGQFRFDELDRFRLLMQGSTLARELTSRRNYEEVLRLCATLKSLADRLAASKERGFALFAKDKLKGIRRREAIAMLGKGDLAGARSAFGQLAAEGNSREKVEARAWIAMANAGLTDFFDVFPSASKELFDKSGERMQAVLREISDQKMEASRLSPTVNVCAGMAEYSRGNYPAALVHFRNAAEGIMLEGRPTNSRAYLWVRFMRSSSQVMSMDATTPEATVADFDAVVGSKIQPASWFYADLVEPAALFPDQRLLPLVLAAVPDEDGEKHFRAYQNADILPRDAQKRIAYAQWLPNSKRRKQEIFDQLCQVIRWDLKAGKTEAAELALDALEQLAEEAHALPAPTEVRARVRAR